MTPFLAALLATVVITPGGGVGPLRIDRSTEAQVRAFAGKPERVATVVDYFDGKRDRSTRYLSYECRRGRLPCKTVYRILVATGRLISFSTSSSRFRTRAGTRVGMTPREAARLEGLPVRRGCLIAITHGPPHHLTIAIENGRVAQLLLGAWDC